MSVSEIEEKAGRLAAEIVDAYVSQDGKDYEKAAGHFGTVFNACFPGIGEGKAMSAAHHYTRALQMQDAVTEQNPPKAERLIHPVWKGVRKELDVCSRDLGISPRYGNHTAEFWRLHSVMRNNGHYGWKPGDGWVAECLQADLYFVEGVVVPEKREDCARITGPLYLAAVSCHDTRDGNGKLPGSAAVVGADIMRQYYSILLKNMK